METRHVILATAGHVDHGKSALVKALTGTDPDRLPEEKARGITIELGFAHLRLERDDVAYSVGIVDVPGHEDFVKNMVAGVGSVDAALLIVAASEGWMPQTEEHLQILAYQGVTRAVVALTKADLVSDLPRATAAVRTKLKDSPLADAAIVPTSVLNGQGLDELRRALAALFAAAPPQPEVGKPRLPLDRVFTLQGVGTVGTGTLTGGVLTKGQAVVVQPGGRTTRIRTLHSHNREIDVARPGSRVAVNLPDLHARGGSREAHGEAVVGRGDVVTLAELGPPTDTLDVLLWRSSRVVAGAAPRPLKDLALVHVHHGSGSVPARVRLLDAPELPAGGRALAQLRLLRPIFALAGDRLVLRDWPGRQTLAGGTVLDADATRDDAGAPPRLAFLKARAQRPDDAAAFVATHLDRFHVARRVTLLVRSRFAAAAAVEAACAQLIASGRAVDLGEWVAASTWWETQLDRALVAIDNYHRNHPEQAGIAIADLLAGVCDGSTEADEMLRATLVEALGRRGALRAGARLRLADHRPRLPAHLQAAGERIRAVLSKHPFDPPSRKELLPDSTSLQALKFLVLNGEAVELGPDQVIASAALAQAVEVIRSHISRHGPATVAELKTALGSSRRVAVPLLEHLDRQGVTTRMGDRRALRAR